MKTDFGEMDITTGTEHSFLGMNVKIDESQKKGKNRHERSDKKAN